MDPLDQQPHGNGDMTAAGDRAIPGHPQAGEELERTGRSVSGRAVGGAPGSWIWSRSLLLMGPPCPSPLSCCIQGKGQSLAVQLSVGSALRPPSSPPGFLGGCCETSGGRRRGMAVTSLMPCTLSASQQCSTSTWQRSPMPSPSGACWGMQLPTCRSVWPLGTSPTLHGNPTQPSPEGPWVLTSYQHPQDILSIA